MKLLALESADAHCSVAIYDATGLAFQATEHAAKMQTQRILPMIEQALTKTQTAWQDLTAIAFSRGPGSFSGVRINAAVAQGLAWAHDLPIIAVSTLQAIAQAAYREASEQIPDQTQTQNQAYTQFTVLMDARMQELYVGHFCADAQGYMQLQGQEQLLSYAAAAEFVAQFPHSCLVGSGQQLIDCDLPRYPSIQQANAVEIGFLAYPLALAGQGCAPELALPVYLRDNAWKKIAEQGKGRV